jgi:hypothetical protein
MQLQNYSSARIESANYREILSALLDLDHIASLQAQILRHLAAESPKQPLGARSR